MADGPPPTLLSSVDGEIRPAGEATISVTDDGFLRGDGAFEMLKLYRGKPFALADHMDRLDRSAAGIFLEYDRPAFEREIAALIAESGPHDAALRLVLSRGGAGSRSSSRSPRSSTASRCPPSATSPRSSSPG